MGWVQSQVDGCLHALYDQTPKGRRLIALLSTHVDDCFCAGAGTDFEAAVKTLRAEFPFGQWTSAREHTLRYSGSEVKHSSDF